MNYLGKIGQIKYYVLQLELSDPEKLSSRCCIFLKKGDKLDLDQVMEETSLEKLITTIPRQSNVLLLFTGDQVLSRYSPEVRTSLFDEIEEKEFYLQKTISEGGWMVQSVCRKSAIDPVLQQIVSQKRFVLDVSLAPVAMPVLERMLPDVTLNSGHYRFDFQNGQLHSISEDTSIANTGNAAVDIEIGDQRLQKDQIPHLAAIVHYFQEGAAHLSLIKSENVQSKFYRRFRKTAILSLVGFFILLLTNFLYFSHLRTKLSEIQNSGKNNLAIVKKIEAKQSEIREYKNLRISGSKHPEETYAFYLEEIAGSRPSGIWFDRLVVHPSSNPRERGKSLEIDYSLLRLDGEARDPVSLNKLIGALEEKEWIKDIELVNYENTPEKTYASFELVILKR